MRFGILGPLQVLRDDGRELTLSGRMARAVLAILLLRANEVVLRDRLVEYLWGDAPPSSGAKALQVHVSRLRSALAAAEADPAAERLITVAGGYQLKVGPEEVDVQRCERLIRESRSLLAARRADQALTALTEALELWRGDALCDFTYDEFAQGEIARLGELRATAVEERVAIEMQLGRDAQVLGELEGLVREYPYRERLRGQLMLALYRAGRQAEALDVFRATRSVLVDELGIEPSPELRQLHDAILAQDGALLEHDSAEPAVLAGVAVEGGAGRESNLPVAATPLIGRERELAELVGLAQSHRLTTLTGPGGTGKTRLAVELAAELGRNKADGVCWVPLTAVTDSRLVTGAIADALGGIEDLATYLSARELLLVLDNFEQVIDAAPDVGALLNSAPRCAALVTSRERLGLAGEQEYPVPPLEPDGAVELFTARARQVEPGFEPGSDIHAICERLDRLPLALELAAPRVKILSEEQLLARLEQRLPLLAGGYRDGPDRQSTMRAAIAWSYDLLSEPEQRLFTRLAVFIGSFELEAAERICDATLDTIQSLIDKSLLRHAENGRLVLLETTREYALEQLLASNEHDEVRARHARWYFALGATAGGHRQGQAESLVRLRRDPGNVDLALAWALDHDVAAGLPLAASVCWAWLGIGRLGEIVQWYRAALENSDALAPAERADALTGLGHALAYSDKLELARTALTEALALYREVGDERNEIEVLLRLGVVEFFTRSPKAALGYQERALAISDRLGDREGIARSLHYMGEALRDMGLFERAAELYTRSIEVRRGNGLGSGASATHSLGDLWLDAGDPVRADGYYKEALKLGIDEGDVRLQAYCLAGLACVAARNEDGRAAGRLWTLAERWEQEVGFRMLGAERVRYERNLPEVFRAGDEYRAGAAEAMDLDVRTATAEIFRGQAAGATPVAHSRSHQVPTDA